MSVKLKAGDTVAIIATARKVKREELEPAVNFLELNGFKVILGPHLFAEDHQFGGTAQQRAEALQWAIDHPEVKLIWCARGGYGTMPLLDKIAVSASAMKNKVLAGFSDVTALHLYFSKLGIPSIHSTMPLSWPENTSDVHEQFLSLISGSPTQLSWLDPSCAQDIQLKGRLIGGNLSLVYAMLGSSYMPSMEGAILFLEDLDEYLYHIHRMLTALRLSGKLSGLKAVVVGGMSDMRDNAIPFGSSIRQIFYDCLGELHIPMVFGAPVGHLNQNMALRLGLRYALRVQGGHVSLAEVGSA